MWKAKSVGSGSIRGPAISREPRRIPNSPLSPLTTSRLVSCMPRPQPQTCLAHSLFTLAVPDDPDILSVDQEMGNGYCGGPLSLLWYCGDRNVVTRLMDKYRYGTETYKVSSTGRGKMRSRLASRLTRRFSGTKKRACPIGKGANGSGSAHP